MADVKIVRIKVVADTASADAGMKRVEKQMKNTATAADRLGSAMARARQTNLAFNRVVQDSPFFFQSFNMGVMATANNIPFLTESFDRLRKETGSTLGALKKFGSSFLGAGGLLSVISLAISGLLSYTIAMQSSKSDIDETTKAVDGLASAFDKLVKIESPFKDFATKMGLDDLEKLEVELEKRITNLLQPFVTEGFFKGLEGDELEEAIQDLIEKVRGGTDFTGEGIRFTALGFDVRDLILASSQLENLNSILDKTKAKISLISDEASIVEMLGLDEPLEDIDDVTDDGTLTLNRLKKVRDEYDKIVWTTEEYKKELSDLQNLQAKFTQGSIEYLQVQQAIVDLQKEWKELESGLHGVIMVNMEERRAKASEFYAQNRKEAEALSKQLEKDRARKSLEEERERQKAIRATERLTLQYAATIGSAFSSMWKEFLDEGKIRFDELLKHMIAGILSLATQNFITGLITNAIGIGTGGIAPAVASVVSPNTLSANPTNFSGGNLTARIYLSENSFVDGIVKLDPAVEQRRAQVERVYS